MVLVILIALWAMVLLPPYLKDRRASGRTFRPTSSGLGGGMSGVGGGINSAQRFLPLQQVSNTYSTSAVSSPTGMRAPGLAPRSAASPSGLGPTATSLSDLGTNPTNVVQLRAVGSDLDGATRPQLPTSAAAYLEEAPSVDETDLHRAWAGSESSGLGMPTSTAAARERRRQVLLSLTGVALVTLLFALFAGGNWIALHVFVDVIMVGYVILLVRHRQMMVDRMHKVEPIRPPVNEQPPTSMQVAPSYLLRSKTGS